MITHTNISALKRAGEALRIAAIAFECQEGMIVTNAQQYRFAHQCQFCRIPAIPMTMVVGTAFDFLRV